MGRIANCRLWVLRLFSTQESTRKLAASILTQLQRSKVYFNEMQALSASLLVGFAISGKEPLGRP